MYIIRSSTIINNELIEIKKNKIVIYKIYKKYLLFFQKMFYEILLF